MPAYRKPIKKTRRTKKSKIITRTTKKYIGKVVLASLVLVAAFVFLGAYGTFKYLTKNFASASSPSSYSIQTDAFPGIAYIVVQDLRADPIVLTKVEFIVLARKSGGLIRYIVPLDYAVAVPGNFGTEEFSRLFALGALNSTQPLVGGTKLVEDTLFKLFGYKVDKYILVDVSLASTTDALFSGESLLTPANFKNISQVSQALKTDFSLKELYDVNTFIHTLKMEQKIVHTGYDYFGDVDSELRDITYESKVASEKKNIAILNGTTYAGVASFAARVVSNMGGRVVASDNTRTPYETSYIITSDPTSATVAFLTHTFNITNIISKTDAAGFLEGEIDRSDITVIFGFDKTH